jgi:hypothetical protein
MVEERSHRQLGMPATPRSIARQVSGGWGGVPRRHRNSRKLGYVPVLGAKSGERQLDDVLKAMRIDYSTGHSIRDWLRMRIAGTPANVPLQ